MGDRPSWQLSACELVKTITSGEQTASEVISAAVDRMRERNPHINAVVGDLGDEALILAAEHDHIMARKGPIGPLHGVPVTIKENIDQKG